MSNTLIASELDIELELNIIGGILLDPNALQRVGNLEPQHFTLNKHRLIYQAIQFLSLQGKPVDMMSVAMELDRTGQLEQAGGQFYLAEIVSFTVDAVNIDHHANLLISKAKKLKVAQTAEEIARLASDKTLTASELYEQLKQQVATLESDGKPALLTALEQVKSVLLSDLMNDAEKEIKIEKIKETFNVKKDLWEKLTRMTRHEVEKIRLDLELKALLQTEDKLTQLLEMTTIAQRYRVSVATLKEALNLMKQKTLTPEFETESLDDLFNSGTQAIDYLIPGLLPKGESALLVAMPKVGKSLLGIDLAFAVATGEDYFLGESCKQGKVLLVSVDESKQSTSRKLLKRGFRVTDKDNIRIVTKFNIEQIGKLEKEIEDFRPSLVIIDSLKRITTGLEISENIAEFADNVYTISELCNRYGASCLLIHHSKKNNESTGVENARGSTAITGACGNVWVLDRIGKEDPNNKKKIIFDPRDPKRKLYCYSRDNEGKAFDLEFNPENNSWTLLGEMGMSEDEQHEQQTAKQRILTLLKINHAQNPEGVSGSFLHECLEMQRPGEISKGYLYVVLNRLVDDKIISSKPAPGDKRFTLYSLPDNSSNQSNSVVIDNNLPSPPPSYVSEDMNVSENYTEQGFEDTYQNTYHTDISSFEPEQIIGIENVSNPYDTYNQGDYISPYQEPEGEGCSYGVIDTLIDNEPLPDDYRPSLKELTNAPSIPPLTRVASVDRQNISESEATMLNDIDKNLSDLKECGYDFLDKVAFLQVVYSSREEKLMIKSLIPVIAERYPNDLELFQTFM